MVAKVLILTAGTGGGHISLAEALRDLLAEHATVQIVDPLPQLVQAHYRLLSRSFPALWAAEYALTNTAPRALALHQLAALALQRSLTVLLRSGNYDLVITTFPFLSYEVMRVIQSLPQPIPFVMLLTDPDQLHATWLTERGATATLAPTRETYAQTLAAGFAPARLHLSGWPVRRQFWNATPRAATLAQLGLDADRFTLFVQGGGEGSVSFARSVEVALAAMPDTIQIIVATGTNHRLLERFSGVAQVRTLSFTPDIAPFMAAADVVVGKAGPNALFEALTLGKPFMATTYIPGQERANLAFIQSYGLGWIALDPREQRALLAALVADSNRLRAMAATVQHYRVWNSTAVSSIAGLLKSLLVDANGNSPGESNDARHKGQGELRRSRPAEHHSNAARLTLVR
jgi:processive 1,2-diacylglycerol beta-glucosyltransferase